MLSKNKTINETKEVIKIKKFNKENSHVKHKDVINEKGVAK